MQKPYKSHAEAIWKSYGNKTGKYRIKQESYTADTGIEIKIERTYKS